MKCDFPLFLAAWNASQRLTTPRIHMKIAKWLATSCKEPNPRLLLMAFRSCGKSTLVGVFCAWLLVQQPDTRILVLSADLALARKMVRNVKRIIERHPLAKGLKPDRLDQWGSEKFTIKRPSELRDPSMLAKGMTTNLTGTRADVIICDDVEVPKTSDTAEKREDLRERLHELDYILTPNGIQLYVGTPHCWNTIYADGPRPELGEDTEFLSGFKRLVQPILDKNGESVWPERFSKDHIDDILRKTGPAHFQSQMMCEPVNLNEGHLDKTALQFYNEALDVREAGGRTILSLCGRKIIGVSGWWDPAFGKANGDRSIVAIVYTDEGGDYWLHHLSRLTLDDNSEDDEATQQCRKVVDLAVAHHLTSIAIETNGLGKFLPGILRRELALSRAPCSIREITSRKPKSVRIIEAFDAVLAARSLHVHRSVLATPFLQEMEDWKPSARGGHDDCLDAVAGAMSLQPVRIPKKKWEESELPPARWIARPYTNKAKTDFQV